MNRLRYGMWRIGVLLAAAFVSSVETRADETQRFKVSIDIQFGPDTGESDGTLFELVDADGKPVAGAGFQNAYNTQDRSDRRQVQFYVIPAGRQKFAPQSLPRPTTDAGTYLFGFENRVFSFSRAGGPDARLRVWNFVNNRWDVDDKTVPLSVSIGSGTLSFDQSRVQFSGETILQLKPEQGFVSEPYSAKRHFLFRRRVPNSNPPGNELVAVEWNAELKQQIAMKNGIVQQLNTPGEFVYAWGQLDNKILAATNTGGVHVFDTRTRTWTTHRTPNGKSYQVYATINYENQLLLGQYPTGELFHFDGEKVAQLRHEPPVMPGVSNAAREAQTLAIYGGELYVGVWPWGEVWKKDRRANEWKFLGRMFTHPAPTDKTTHPYEDETKSLDPTLNRWGQRVTSLVPYGDLLIIATSAKGPNPYEEKFTFLANDKWKEYGTVYRYRKPGSLSAPFAWKSSTKFEFELTGKEMLIRQDGKPIGSIPFDEPAAARPAKLRADGVGVFGPLNEGITRVQWTKDGN